MGGTTVFVTCSEYEDGRLGEVFVVVSKAGTAMRASLEALAISISIGLQHGVPFGIYRHALEGMDFKPSGPVLVGDEATEARSIIDFLVKHVSRHYDDDGHRREP